MAQPGRTRKVAAHMGAGAGPGAGTAIGTGIGNGAGGAAGALGAAVAALYTATLPPGLPGGDAGKVPGHRTSARGGWCIAGSLRRGARGDQPAGPGTFLSPHSNSCISVTPVGLLTPEGLVHCCHPTGLLSSRRDADPIGAGTLIVTPYVCCYPTGTAALESLQGVAVTP